MNKKLFWLVLIMAFILRFYQLGQIPLTLDWDEASNAYNAYSILKTARDEYGKFLPLYNRSFDDYKPPAYMYLNVPTVAIFGLTPFAARLPSAVFGFLTVPALYFLTKRLLDNEKIALLSAFLLAVSPWHLQFSRVGFEANVGLAAAVAAFTFFLYAINSENFKTPRQKKLLIISAILFGASFYTYHSMRIFIPLLLVATLLVFRQQFFKISKKYIAVFLMLLVLTCAPLFIFVPRQALSGRYETTTQSARLADINKSIEFILQEGQIGSKFASLIHNRRLVIAQTQLRNYLSHFDFNFLFTTGDNNFRHHVENMGMLYLFEIPLILYGLYLFVKNVNGKKLFILSWLILSPIPASLGDAIPHAVRSQTLIIPLQIIAAYALVEIYQKIKQKRPYIISSTVIIGISVLAYLHNYYRHYPFDQASSWQFGYDQAALQTANLKDKYQKIIVDHSIEQAYIFWLFNLKYDPNDFQKNGSRSQFDKFYFDAKAPENHDELFVSMSLPGSFEVVKTIYYADGKEAIRIGHPR